MRTMFLVQTIVALCLSHVSFKVLADSSRTQGNEKKASTMIDATRSDEDTVRNVRKAITDDDSLSMSAKNVTITSKNGRVNLTGKVRDQEERSKVIEKAQTVSKNVKADLDVEK